MTAMSALFRRHPDRAVEPDHLAVEHRIATISRTSDANSSGRPSRGGNGTILPSDSCTSGGRLRHHRRLEDAGRDRHHANAGARELARDRQRHADDPAFDAA